MGGQLQTEGRNTGWILILADYVFLINWLVYWLTPFGVVIDDILLVKYTVVVYSNTIFSVFYMGFM